MGSLQAKVDAQLDASLKEREVAMAKREQKVEQAEARNATLEREMAEERHRMQAVLAKLEVEMAEQRKQLDQQKYCFALCVFGC